MIIRYVLMEVKRKASFMRFAPKVPQFPPQNDQVLILVLPPPSRSSFLGQAEIYVDFVFGKMKNKGKPNCNCARIFRYSLFIVCTGNLLYYSIGQFDSDLFVLSDIILNYSNFIISTFRSVTYSTKIRFLKDRLFSNIKSV